MKLRPYQLEAERSTLKAWADGNRTALGVLPTGCGKTIVFASLIRSRLPGRTMVLAHRQELIWQARDKIEEVTGLTADVEMGEFKAAQEAGLFSPKAQVIVSTIQTHTAGGDGAGRMGKFDPMDFSTLIVDEAHHATSPSYRRAIDYYLTNPNLVVLGVTATPDRSDEEALGQIFGTVVFDYEILNAINDGWLIPIEQQMVSIESLDFSKVRTTAGDLNGADLAAVMESEKNLHGIAHSTIDIAGDRRGLGFASSVAHAKALSEIFNRHRYGMSNWVCAGTDKDERKKIIMDFAAGKIQWLWNCGVFTEGFDDSGVEIISMARPTKSRSLYAQMAGRGTRPHKSIAYRLNDAPAAVIRRMMIARSVKPSCLIIDHVGNSGKHKLMTTADILGGNVSEEVLEAAVSTAMRAKGPVRMDKVIEDEEEKLAAMKAKRLAEEARRHRLVAKSTYKTTNIDPFDLLQIKPVKSRGWDQGKLFSEKQSNFLRQRGFNPDEMDYAKGKQLIGVMMNRFEKKLCTLKQASTLKKFGYDVNMTFDQASATLDALASNNWQKPAIIKPTEAPLRFPKPPPRPRAAPIPFEDDLPF